MTGMAIPSGALWNWFLHGLVAAAEIQRVLAEILARPVLPLGAVDPAQLPADVLLCDVWHTGGDFPTRVDCYLAPTQPAEPTVAALLARRLGCGCLLPDDTLDPGRFLLAAPDGTLRAVHVDVKEHDDGPHLSRLRPCTKAERPVICHQSRWAPDTVVPGAAAA